jgi:alpha-D-xyloside xylohydrolase
MSEIIHIPYGQEHPYSQGPEERFPRDPLAGQPFTVGIVTRPPGTVAQVRMVAQLEGQPDQTIEAVQQHDWRPQLEQSVGMDLLLERVVIVDQDVWHATLIAPAHGHTLTYWIEADGLRTDSYTLRGEAWTSEYSNTPFLLPVCTPAPNVFEMRIARSHDAAFPSSALPDNLPTLRKIEWLTDGERARRVRLTFDCAPDEAFYGLGERFNALNQRGNMVDVRCYEQYRDQGTRTYIPIPFLLARSGYGLYVESNRWMQFDLSQSDCWVLEADVGPDETLTLTWLVGDDPLAISGKFARRTGPPALPPLWAFGLWMSGNEWNSQARVMREIERSLAHDIIPSVVVIEAWSDETTFYIWNDAEYTPVTGDRALSYADFKFPPDGKWPDPQGMVDALHDRNIRVVLWQIPILKHVEYRHAQHDADRDYFEIQGFGVHNADGSRYRVRPPWFRHSYLWDMTDPAEREWWFSKRAYLLEDMGIDGFKTDGGEHLWGAETRFSDGRHGGELWNVYPQLYTEAYYQLATEKRDGDAVTFSRAGFVGSQRSPVHWAGDENSSWEAFRHSILAGLSAGLSGIPFWGWDLGGFSGDIPSAELYLRSAAMAAFCPIMQYHSEFNDHREPCRDRTPWNIQARTGDERVIPYFRFFVNVRHNLMPYIWQEAQYAAQTGQPMMCALTLTHPEASPYQYFFGRDLLVSPVVEEGVSAWSIYLPTGIWFDLWTREQLTGGQHVQVVASLDRIPVFVCAGAAIPVVWGAEQKFGDSVPLNSSPNDTVRYG